MIGLAERCSRNIQPLFFVFRSEDHRHTVVNRPHKFIWFRGDDGEALHFFTVWLADTSHKAASPNGSRLLRCTHMGTLRLPSLRHS